LDEFSHQPYDQKQRIVPEPKMGGQVLKRYEDMMDSYLSKKELNKRVADRKIDD